MADAINTYDVEALIRAFPEKPFWGSLACYFQEPIEASAEVKGVKLAFRIPFSSRARFKYGAWLWLRPHEPTWRDTATLQSALALDRYNFGPGLREACLEYARDYPLLSKWIHKRLALAEYDTAGRISPRPEHERAKTSLRRELFRAFGFLYYDVDLAARFAAKLVEDALHAAAQHAQHVLGNGCPISANLMVPVPKSVTDALQNIDDDLLRENARSAEAIWRDVRADEGALVVAAETDAAKHQGFWVPIAVGRDGKGLPGATEAYKSRVGSSVFVDDLPPLAQGFDLGIQQKWHGHMSSPSFQDRLFVSMPLVISKGGMSDGKVVAVLNVNAGPRIDDPEAWRRAYHQVWLRTAQDGCSEFAEIAYYALLIQQKARNRLVLSGAGQLQSKQRGWTKQGQLLLPDHVVQSLMGMELIDRSGVDSADDDAAGDDSADDDSDSMIR